MDFISRIAYGADHELGWDSSITLYEPSVASGALQYDIVVRQDDDCSIVTYRTKRMISNIGADTLRGRGTRVWEVVELDDNGEERDSSTTCVLKDSWVDENMRREGEIHRHIRADAAAKGLESPENVAMGACLLTVNTYGDVFIDNQPDKTRHWDLPSRMNFIKVKVEPKTSSKAKSDWTPVGAIMVQNETTSDHSVSMSAASFFPTKVHHRIVFKEVGKTIRELSSLRRVFRRLTEVVICELMIRMACIAH